MQQASKHHHGDWPGASLEILVSMIVLAVANWELFYVRTLMPRVKHWVTKQPFYASLVGRSGHLARSGQDDVVIMFVLAFHHMTSGSLALLGHLLDDPLLFRAGVILEMGFECSDSIAILRGSWPHVRGRRGSMLMSFALLVHHLPGLCLTVPVFSHGFDSNPHFRVLVSWLLFAGGVSALCGGYVHTRNFDDQYEMMQAALAQCIGGLFFIVARFYVFPKEVYHLSSELHRGHMHEIMAFAIPLFSVALFIFNLIVLRQNIRKSIKYVLRAVGFKSTNVYDLLAQEKPQLSGSQMVVPVAMNGQCRKDGGPVKHKAI